jgi:hypothetical protein
MKQDEITHHTLMQQLFKWQYLKAIAHQSLARQENFRLMLWHDQSCFCVLDVKPVQATSPVTCLLKTITY